jgi:hypothetical protein
MLSILIALGISFPLEGRWLGNFTSSSDENTTSFSVTFKTVGVRFKGVLRSTHHKFKFLPKLVDIREIRVNRTFIILLPLRNEEKFVQFDVAECPGGFLNGTAGSDDGAYNVSVAIHPDNAIEVELADRKTSEWVHYSIARRRSEAVSGATAWAVVAAIILVVAAVLLLIIWKVIQSGRRALRKAD